MNRAAYRLTTAAALLAVAAFPGRLQAQVPDTTPAADTTDVSAAPAVQPAAQTPPQAAATPSDTAAGGVTPFGAFLRAVALPGWGHASVGAYGRGAFYVLVDGGTSWMLFKTITFLRRARELERGRTDDALRDLQAQGITDPDSIAAALEDDGGVSGARRLVEAREQQLEDWIALTVFFFLLEGADAYVSGHLAGFPEPVASLRADGAVELGVRVPVPW